MFSRSVQYAIRAMTFLAVQPPGKLSGAREIAEAEHIPGPFLWKILKQLTRQKLVRSFKGVRGGYELARPAGRVRVADIIAAVDGMKVVTGCILGLPECQEENPCPLHPLWKALQQNLPDLLRQTHLAELAQVVKQRADAR